MMMVAVMVTIVELLSGTLELQNSLMSHYFVQQSQELSQYNLHFIIREKRDAKHQKSLVIEC